jgi:hypothetical protein
MNVVDARQFKVQIVLHAMKAITDMSLTSCLVTALFRHQIFGSPVGRNLPEKQEVIQ